MPPKFERALFSRLNNVLSKVICNAPTQEKAKNFKTRPKNKKNARLEDKIQDACYGYD